MSLASWIADDGTILLLDGSQGVKVQRGGRGFDGPPIRNTFDQRVGDGAIRVNSRHPERPLQLPLLVDEQVISAGEVFDLFQSGRFVSSSGRELHQVVYDGGFEGQWSIDTGGVEGLSHRKFPAALVALDPWWHGPLEFLSGAFGAATPWDAPIPWDSPIPWNGGSSQSISNSGDVATFVTVVLTGPATSVSMSIGGSGGWSTAAPILSGDYLTVDGNPGVKGPRRGPSGLFPAPSGPVDHSLLTPGSQLFELPKGVSSLVFGASDSDANTRWAVLWAPRFQSS